MSGFFLECQKIGDRSSILLILDQIGISSIDFGFDILLYAIENFEPAIEKIFFNLFKEAEMIGSSEENKGTMFGEIQGDGMIIDSCQQVSQDLINECVDLESEEVQNAIIVKTMRCQVSDVLGS